MILPQARNENIVMQEIDQEVLIYDLVTHHAVMLNETLKIIFNACDGKTTIDELKVRHNFTDDVIFLAIDELKKAKMLKNSEQVPLNFKGMMSRREVIKRIGVNSMLALPIIVGITAPVAAQSLSSCLGPRRTLNGQLVTSGGDVFCTTGSCTSAALTPSSDGCCSGFAVSATDPNCNSGVGEQACRCQAAPTP